MSGRLKADAQDLYCITLSLYTHVHCFVHSGVILCITCGLIKCNFLQDFKVQMRPQTVTCFQAVD
jgi:hypothetical protein